MPVLWKRFQWQHAPTAPAAAHLSWRRRLGLTSFDVAANFALSMPPVLAHGVFMILFPRLELAALSTSAPVHAFKSL